MNLRLYQTMTIKLLCLYVCVFLDKVKTTTRLYGHHVLEYEWYYSIRLLFFVQSITFTVDLSFLLYLTICYCSHLLVALLHFCVSLALLWCGGDAVIEWEHPNLLDDVFTLVISWPRNLNNYQCAISFQGLNGFCVLFSNLTALTHQSEGKRKMGKLCRCAYCRLYV